MPRQKTNLRSRGACGWAALCVLVLASAPCASATEVKLWPLFEVKTQAPDSPARFRLLGPLFDLTTRADAKSAALRPLALYRSEAVERGWNRRLWLLYPLASAADAPDRTDMSLLGGLASYRSGPTWVKARLFPIFFFDWSREKGVDLSILPFYGRFHNQLGFQRIDVVLFPLYLRLTKGLWHRSFYLFPFFGTTGGPGASGFRVWPLYGRRTLGAYHHSGFIAWPFYIWQREERAGIREDRRILFPLLASIESENLSSRAYGISLFTHTLDRKLARETFGFPWPLSVYEQEDGSGATATLRIFPFYQKRVSPSGVSRFIGWPLFREKWEDGRGYHYRRTDLLLLLFRKEKEEREEGSGERSLFTLFPFYRRVTDGGYSSAGAPALLDSLLPANQVALDLYAPLWQLWAHERHERGGSWTLLWDAVSSEGGRIEYPWRWR